MSGLVAAVMAAPERDGRRMLERLRARGSQQQIHSAPGVLLGAVHDSWEAEPIAAVDGSAGGAIAVAADASLFYRDDLARALGGAGVRASPGDPPAALILAAYRAWGAGCAARLEGDFAFALWDAGRQELVCARDFGGRRPLFFAELAGGVLVGSSVAALLSHPACPADLDVGAVGAAAAGLFGSASDTAFRAVRSVPAGSTLRARGGVVRIERHWTPPEVEGRPFVRGTDLDQGAEQLRSLLVEAVRERMDPQAPTAIWLSGGWDSTAVLAAGTAASGGGSTLRPVSISYPEGDPGREDELIEAATRFCGVPVHWLRIGEIPMLDDAAERAGRRDEPFGHPYEMWNRALARGCRTVGARVALDGVGGDQLFQVSYVYLAELLRRGRFRSLARELRAKGMRGWGDRFQWALVPLLPPALRALARGVIGPTRVADYLERPIPPWIRTDFARRHRLREREREGAPPREGRSPVAYETHWYLTHPYGAKVLSAVASFARDEGVELRSPLHDERVVRFAVSRPWSERTWGRETKRLLRRAMEGWLPREVLAPRLRRTGITSGYLDRSLRRDFAGDIEELLQRSVLQELGIVDATALRNSWRSYLHTGDEGLAVSLYLSLQTELWIRGRAGE